MAPRPRNLITARVLPPFAALPERPLMMPAMSCFGDNLYVANTDSIVRYPYTAGATKIDAPGVELADLPSTVNHHWTKSLAAK